METVLAKGEPQVDWEVRLAEYLQQLVEQGDRDATYRTVKTYLTPWVRWLKTHGGRPTNQRLKAYLVERGKYMRTSYWKVGRAIRDFSNHYAEQWNKVSLIRPHGQRREKATLALPEPAFAAVKEHVKLRALKFGPQAETLATAQQALTLAKDLGK